MVLGIGTLRVEGLGNCAEGKENEGGVLSIVEAERRGERKLK